MSTQGSVTSSTRKLASENWTLVLASTGVFLVALELTIVSVALPAIVDDLNPQIPSRVSWIFSAYNMVVATLLLIFGWLADQVGRRRIFVVGLVVFAGGSAVSGAAENLFVLVSGRVMQGLGGSMMLPASLALILAAVHPKRRESAIASWSAMAGLAAAIGPLAGGALVATLGWRSVFFLNVPLAAIAIFLVRRHVAESQAYPASLASALNDLAGAPSFLVRLRSFRWAGLAALPFVAGFTAWVVMVPTFLHEVWNYSAVKTGFAMLPAPLAMALIARPAARFVDALGYRGLIATGACLAAVGLFWLWAFVGSGAAYAIEFLPGALLFGAGVGIGFPMLAAAAVVDVPQERYATGAAGVTTLRQSAMALGAALAISVVSQHGADSLLSGHTSLWLLCAGLLAVSALVTLGMPASTSAAQNSLLAAKVQTDV